jgi:hypothetical protein
MELLVLHPVDTLLVEVEEEISILQQDPLVVPEAVDLVEVVANLQEEHQELQILVVAVGLTELLDQDLQVLVLVVPELSL